MSEAPTDQDKKSNPTKQILKKGGYSPIPNDLQRAIVSFGARCLWEYLFSHKEGFYPRYEQISYEMGMRHRSISRYLSELTNNNMISISHGKDNSNIYTIKQPSEWFKVRSRKIFGRGENVPTGRGENAPTNKTKNKTNNNTTTTELPDAPILHTKEKVMFQGEFPELVDEISKELTNLDIEHQHRAVEMAVGTIYHNYGWDISRIKEKLPEALIYLIEANPKNIMVGLINFHRYYNEPKRSKPNSPNGSTGDKRRDDIIARNKRMDEARRECEEQSNVIDIASIKPKTNLLETGDF